MTQPYDIVEAILNAPSPETAQHLYRRAKTLLDQKPRAVNYTLQEINQALATVSSLHRPDLLERLTAQVGAWLGREPQSR